MEIPSQTTPSIQLLHRALQRSTSLEKSTILCTSLPMTIARYNTNHSTIQNRISMTITTMATRVFDGRLENVTDTHTDLCTSKWENHIKAFLLTRDYNTAVSARSPHGAIRWVSKCKNVGLPFIHLTALVVLCACVCEWVWKECVCVCGGGWLCAQIILSMCVLLTNTLHKGGSYFSHTMV